MAAQILWSDGAEEDLAQIYEFISRDSLRYAEIVIRALLQQHPDYALQATGAAAYRARTSGVSRDSSNGRHAVVDALSGVCRVPVGGARVRCRYSSNDSVD